MSTPNNRASTARAEQPTGRTTEDGNGHEMCSGCRRHTSRGKRQREEMFRAKPIYGTDFTQPIGEIIESVRVLLGQARGTLHDIEHADAFWRERVEPITGLLTCGIQALYAVRAEVGDLAERALLPTSESAEVPHV